jgi:DNA-binding Lrp family transcriptional regulator
MTTNSSNSMNISHDNLTLLEKHLLNDFQHDFPLVSRPFKQIADNLKTTEDMVVKTIEDLQQRGYVSRVGAVFKANSIGASTLAAMKIPENKIEEIADLVSAYSEVNHNYQREHDYNLWFVLTAADEHELNSILDDIEYRTGYPVMYLPMIEDFHIDLGFDLGFGFSSDVQLDLKG